MILLLSLVKELLLMKSAKKLILIFFYAPLGGGLISGIYTYKKEFNKNYTVYGVEPGGAASMSESLKQGRLTKLDTIDTFVDGASVKQVGDLTYQICKENNCEVLLSLMGGFVMKLFHCTKKMGLLQNLPGPYLSVDWIT